MHLDDSACQLRASGTKENSVEVVVGVLDVCSLSLLVGVGGVLPFGLEKGECERAGESSWTDVRSCNQMGPKC